MSQHSNSVLASLLAAISNLSTYSRSSVSHSSCSPSASAKATPLSTLTLQHPRQCLNYCLSTAYCCICRYKLLPPLIQCTLPHGGRCRACTRVKYVEGSLLEKEDSLVRACIKANNLVTYTQRCEPQYIATVRPVASRKNHHEQDDCLSKKVERSMDQLKSIACPTQEANCTCTCCKILSDLTKGVMALKRHACEYILASDYANHNGHKTTFDDLPAEIVAYIFENTLEPDWQTPQTTPLILCAVSRRWRYIAQNDQALWTSIHLNSSFEYGPICTPNPQLLADPSNKTQWDLFNEWLSRSGTHQPLSLTVTLSVRYTCPLQGNSTPRQLDLLEILLEFYPYVTVIHQLSGRLRNLNVQSLYPILDLIKPAYDSSPLRSLTLTALDGEHPWTNDDIEDAELEDFSVVQSDNFDMVPDFFFSTTGYANSDWKLQRATHIAAQYVGTSRLVDALHTAPDLLECRINHFINSPYPPVREFALLNKLVSLYVNDTACQGLGFLADVYFPALRSLSVHLCQEINTEQSQLIRRFLQNSHCKLLEFEVSSEGLRSQSLMVMVEVLFKSPQFCTVERLVLRKLDFKPVAFMSLLGETAIIDDGSRSQSESLSNGALSTPTDVGNHGGDNNTGPSKDIVILPGLKHLVYSSNLTANIPWEVVPTVFGPLNPSHKTHWRPLGILEIKHEWIHPNGDTSRPILDSHYGKLTEQAVTAMIKVIDFGHTLMLPSKITKDDLTNFLQEIPAKK